MSILIVLTLAFVMSADETTKNQGSERLDKSKAFVYTLPKGWQSHSMTQFPHDLVLLPKTDDKNRSIIISDQPGDRTLAEDQKVYERELPKALKDFKLIESEIVELANKQKAVKIIHTNRNPGVLVRQVNYIFEVGEKRYFAACTVMAEDGEKYDKEFEKFVSGIREPKKKVE